MDSTRSFQTLQEEIRALALACSRDPNEIELVVVTKGHPWKKVAPLYEVGARIFGENRVQEMLLKKEASGGDVKWHFIGSLQLNKVQKIVGQCALIHSIDSVRLAEKIGQKSEEMGIVTEALLQVNTSGEATKHGFAPDGVEAAYSKISSISGLSIVGLMTIGPLTEEAVAIRKSFARLRELRNALGLFHLSMGMSHDYRIAIEEGATLLRIGSLILGERHYKL